MSATRTKWVGNPNEVPFPTGKYNPPVIGDFIPSSEHSRIVKEVKYDKRNDELVVTQISGNLGEGEYPNCSETNKDGCRIISDELNINNTTRVKGWGRAFKRSDGTPYEPESNIPDVYIGDNNTLTIFSGLNLMSRTRHVATDGDDATRLIDG